MVASNVKNVNRQWPLVSVTRITAEDFADGANIALTGLPGNAIVTGGALIVQTVWDAATTINIGDEAVADRYADGVNLAALGRTALTLTGFQTPTPQDILGVASATTAVTGEALLIVEYVVEGRGGEVQY